ncbi:MAG: CBS domain-containing protein [Scytonematopsis contorta HA4267-MV1]|jgi:CBS domain-containing protein|nr:CBS domain-containing protein [Scytonematopsis contorta HA4267-MV1]
MQPNALIPSPELEAAIDYQPLIVTPDTRLSTVIALMVKKQGNSSTLPQGEKTSKRQNSCALVMEEKNLLGIFTEKDIIQYTAINSNFKEITVGSVMTKQVITLPLEAFRDIFGPLFLFRRYGIRHLPIIGELGELVGVVTNDSLRDVLQPADFLKLRRVSEVMTTPVLTTDMKTSVLDVVRLMAQHRVSCVVITQNIEDDEGDIRVVPVGIVTERDVVKFQEQQFDLFATPVRKVMSTPLLLLSPEDSLWKAHEEMLRLGVRRLVVSWDWGRGAGIITMTNLLRVLDPIETSGIRDLCERSVIQNDVEKLEHIFQQNNKALNQLRTLLSETEINLKTVAEVMQTMEVSNQSQLQSVLENLQLMQNIVQDLDERSQIANGDNYQNDDADVDNLTLTQKSVKLGQKTNQRKIRRRASR